jgi:DNA topoisomerase-1
LPINKEGKVVELPMIKLDCDKCGKPMTTKLGKTGPFLACSGYPECSNKKFLDREGKIMDLPDVSGETCEKCGGPMVIRMSRRGPFLGCAAFPKCRNARPMPGDEKAPAK